MPMDIRRARFEQTQPSYLERRFQSRPKGTTLQRRLVQWADALQLANVEAQHFVTTPALKWPEMALDEALYPGIDTWLTVEQEYWITPLCQASLEALSTSGYWRSFLAPLTSLRVVSLGGGGSGRKDIALLSRTLSWAPGLKVFHRIIDTSRPMTEYAQAAIEQQLIEPIQSGRLVLEATHADITALAAGTVPGAEAGGHTVFMILGQTFGNLREADFMQSVARNCAVGDHLIVGLELIPEDCDLQRFSDRVIRRYGVPAIANFIAEPLKAALAELVPNRNAARSAIHRLEGRIYPPELAYPKHSQVPNAISYQMVLPVAGRTLVGIRSNRYSLESLGSFAESFGFDLVKSFYAECSDYAQLVFRFNGRDCEQFANAGAAGGQLPILDGLVPV